MYVCMYVCMYAFEYVTDSSSKKRPLLEGPEDLRSCSDSPRDRPCIVGFDQRVTAPNMLTMDASLHGFSGPLSTACMYICSRENVMYVCTRFPLSGCSPISIVHCVGLPHPTLPYLTPTTPDMILRFRESCVLSICQCTCTLISPSPAPSK